ncbi:ATP-binding cassette domain-containing protein [Sporosarcina sp. ANT_H38]|uniref:ABC transporter ATP-binding protein n=1 Tax=Sporosarcina sp. ANT_H38 TaxID=2597358 RepID=UPI0011F28E74|nr:energy-coupling factor transporter ATPase [Sporosarcina sp. ANT_H38]KAA0966845.1 ATP-binding cassette domain-containing protein [Sporosarcina sp. ANT_H38]
MNSIRVENLKYKYPNTDTFALDGISFTVNKGEFIGIAGMNTAGKTTLCYALSGLVPHFFKGSYGGDVFIGDMNVFTHEISAITAKVGLVFENPFSQMTGAKFTVYDEIAFGLENLGLPRDEMHARINESMQFLDIEDLKDKNPFSLSGGQMQRLAIASVIAMKPDILILDEPTSQLDPQGSEEVFRVVEKLSKEGMTIIMVEQKMEKLAAYSDRIFLMHEGKLKDSGSPSEIFSRDDLHTFGVESPVYTKVAKALNIKNKVTGLYPISLEEMPASGITKADIQVISETTPLLNTVSPEIIVKNLQFSYKEENPILHGVSVMLSGEPTAIIGQNGAGKTTFVKLLKALSKPVSGDIIINGTNTKGTTAAKLASTIGLIFQNPNDQIFKNNVLDEVMFGPLNVGQTPEVARVNAEKMLKLVGLSNKAGDNPYDLSLAERKMITVAAILAMDTDIVIFDEPTMGQDVHGKAILKEIIRGLHIQGKLVLCILHDMDFVAETFSRTIVFSSGQLLFDGPTREAFADQAILHTARLEQPHITQLARQMGYEGILLTESELIRE